MKNINLYILPFSIRSVWISKDQPFQNIYNINDINGLRKYIGWWIINGWREYPGVSLTSSFDLINSLEAVGPGLRDTFSHNGIIAQCILFEWEFLSSQFIKNEYMDLEFKSWWDENHLKYFPLLELYYEGWIQEEAKLNHLTRPIQDIYAKEKKTGVNLIGMGDGILGIGEDARTVTKAIDQCGIDVGLFPYPQVTSKDLLDLRLKNFFIKKLKFNINIFTIPIFETQRAFVELGKNILLGYYNIGYWQWELPFFPENYKIVTNYFDEIWSSSKFTYHALKSLCNKNIYHMPLPVEIDVVPVGDRISFGLDDGIFYFLSVIDGNSWLTRKNPEGVINSFQAAFPISKKHPVGLIFKVINVTRNPAWSKLITIISKDPRIKIIDSPLARAKLFGLISSVDALISLHRSEGFGRVPAEAMLLQKPVIVTAYSGNMDYCNIDNSFLVDYDLIPLSKGDYNLWEGQTWAQPKLDSAVEMLRTCFDNSSLRDFLAKNGQIFIQNNYSISQVAKIYKKNLEKIALQQNLWGTPGGSGRG